jgi:hypothetical protein
MIAIFFAEQESAGQTRTIADNGRPFALDGSRRLPDRKVSCEDLLYCW